MRALQAREERGRGCCGAATRAAAERRAHHPPADVARAPARRGISLASFALRDSCGLALPAAAAPLALAAIPLRPTYITGLNLVLTELHYASSALASPGLRGPWALHAALAASATAAFALEDVAAAKGFTLCHSLWHTLAAGAMWSTSALMAHAESRGGPLLLAAAV